MRGAARTRGALRAEAAGFYDDMTELQLKAGQTSDALKPESFNWQEDGPRFSSRVDAGAGQPRPQPARSEQELADLRELFPRRKLASVKRHRRRY